MEALTEAYLSRAVRNAAISIARSDQRRSVHRADLERIVRQQPPGERGSASPEGPLNSDVGWLVTATERLPPRCRAVMLLKISGRTNGEIAAALGIAIKTVEYHYSAGVRVLRETAGPCSGAA